MNPNLTQATELRTLTADELINVSGAHPVVAFVAGLIGGKLADSVAEDLGIWKPVVEYKGGKMHVAGKPLR
jgi:hypothetical protein